MEGCEDPFNRGTFPWGHEDPILLHHYRTLGRLRKARPSLQKGSIEYLEADGGLLVFRRVWEKEVSLIALNNGPQSRTLTLPWAGDMAIDALSRQQFFAHNGALHITLPPEDGVLLTEL